MWISGKVSLDALQKVRKNEMKKMIMMLAAIALAAVAQAATVTWTAVDPNAKGVYLL